MYTHITYIYIYICTCIYIYIYIYTYMYTYPVSSPPVSSRLLSARLLPPRAKVWQDTPRCNQNKNAPHRPCEGPPGSLFAVGLTRNRRHKPRVRAQTKDRNNPESYVFAQANRGRPLFVGGRARGARLGPLASPEERGRPACPGPTPEANKSAA